ncbi:MAG: T9SS type A sorting domain-containing protein [Melioribacteraceae bacterium]|nr:MAG: T9SS type A sorting domain-containing protein [Melioribacteraceae bacterium]
MKSQTNFSLEQNYPNPFNPVTKISFHIPNVGDALYASATLGIYNILGELVTTLINQNLSAGKYEIEFDASNLTSGIYYYRLLTNNFTQTRKMLLVK